MQLQGHFRKGCILEAMDRYDDVSLYMLPLYPLSARAYRKEDMILVLSADICSVYILQALASFQTALQYNPQSSEVSRKIKRISQLMKDKNRAQEVENLRSNIDMAKHLEKLKTEMVNLV